MSEPSQARKSRMWVGVVLVLSLAVNTFFVGIVVGSRVTSEHWADRIRDRMGVERGLTSGGMRGVPPALDPRHFGRMLPESARESAREHFEARGPEIHSLFEDAAAARIAAYDAMRVQPFDREALEAAFVASRVADQAAAAAAHALVIEILSDLTPEERAAVEVELGRLLPSMDERRELFERMRGHRDRPPRRERRP